MSLGVMKEINKVTEFTNGLEGIVENQVLKSILEENSKPGAINGPPIDILETDGGIAIKK